MHNDEVAIVTVLWKRGSLIFLIVMIVSSARTPQVKEVTAIEVIELVMEGISDVLELNDQLTKTSVVVYVLIDLSDI